MRPSLRAASAAALAALAMAPEAGAAERARPADAFVDSVGVNVHLGYTNTPYRRYDIIQEKLRALGVRHIRDGLNPGQPFVYRAWRTLAGCGIKLNLIIGDPLQRHGIGPLESQLALMKRSGLTEALASIEAPNEYDNQGDPRWQQVLRDYQRDLYRRVNADPSLARIPVLGPSLVKRGSRAQLGDLSGSLDYGNMHPYPGGHAPDRDSHMGQELDLAEQNSGVKPVQATETGYHNGVSSAASHKGASEHAAGIYMPRLFLDYFRRGIARTYSYELLDQFPDDEKENSEANYGLLRNDFSEKPAFKAISRLTRLLRDPGPAFRTRALSYSLEGEPSDLRQVLLQKRDGSFYLALWKDTAVWDPNARRAVAAGSDSLRVVLPERARRLELYRPGHSLAALTQRSKVRSLPVDLSSGVAIVRIVPGRRKGATLGELRGRERRIARALLRLRAARPASAAVHRRTRLLARWLSKRSRTIRRNARHRGWHEGQRRVRYRAIRKVLRRA